MSNELTLALVASGTSLVVAIVGLIASLITIRHSTRASRAIELLKHELARKQASDALADGEFTQSTKALQVAIQSIQQVKDEIALALSEIAVRRDKDATLKRMGAARQGLFECHEQQMAFLNAHEERILHQAKNSALAVERLVEEELLLTEVGSGISPGGAERLMELRLQLTDLQQQLRDHRSDRLVGRFGQS